MKRLFFIFCVFVAGFNTAAQSVPDYKLYEKMSVSELDAYRQSIWDSLPAIGWVNDFEGLYNHDEEDSLESSIQHFEKLTTVEIAIVTVDSNMVRQDRFNDFSDHLLRVWGVGKFTKKNGIVICISRDYKKLYISTGAGITKYITDEKKNHIIAQNFIPSFNEHKYFEGTLQGLNVIMNKISKTSNRVGR